MKCERIMAMLLVLSSIFGIGKVFSQTSSSAQQKKSDATLQSETPAKFEPTNDGFDYVRRDVMIPMRDGVKLHTVIIVPKGGEARADPADADALQRDGTHQPHVKRPSRPDLNWL